MEKLYTTKELGIMFNKKQENMARLTKKLFNKKIEIGKNGYYNEGEVEIIKEYLGVGKYTIKDICKMCKWSESAVERQIKKLYPTRIKGEKLTKDQTDNVITNINKRFSNLIIKKHENYTELEAGKNIFLVDNDDLEKILQYHWMSSNNTNKTYIKDVKHKPRIYLHRLILNAKKGEVVDHINGNTLDNRKSNLRICTMAQNSFNRSKQHDNTSGFKGVWYRKDTKKWAAEIRANGKKQRLGCFATPEEAYAAYCKAAKELHGEFARIA